MHFDFDEMTPDEITAQVKNRIKQCESQMLDAAIMAAVNQHDPKIVDQQRQRVQYAKDGIANLKREFSEYLPQKES